MNTKTTQNQHFALYKLYGYLSQFVNRQTKRKNKKLLGELYNFSKDTTAIIGRLDEKLGVSYKSWGLSKKINKEILFFT